MIEPKRDAVVWEQLQRWLDWLEKSETQGICVYFQDTSLGLECSARNCPCELYQEEEEYDPSTHKD